MMVRNLRKLAGLAALICLALLSACQPDDPGLPQTGPGTVFINCAPDEQSFPWRLEMPGQQVVTGQGDSMLVDMPLGTYRVTWQSYPHWDLPYPTSQRQAMPAEHVVNFTGIYTPEYLEYPIVPEVEVQHGQEPGQITVKWMWYLSADHATEHYLVGMSTAGPIEPGSWPDCQAFGQVEHLHNQVGYQYTFSTADGLVPGLPAWFAVRAVDGEGWMTHTGVSPELVVSREWWAEGVVHDPLGHPVPGVVIGCAEVDEPVVSAADGSYRLGPLLDLEAVHFWTDASAVAPWPGTVQWLEYQGPGYFYEGKDRIDLMVVPRLTMDPDCSTYGDDFLRYLRYMTKTEAPVQERPNQRLCSWDHYPVRVHVPQYVREDGLDFGAATRTGIAIWNLALEEEILVHEGVGPDEADIVFEFADLGSLVNGVTSLAEPVGQGADLGYIVPEKISIGVNNVVLPNEQRVQETALHEMGHALGLYRHVQLCNMVGYLMGVTSAGALDDGPENAIHEDEVNAMRIIRYLPRWMDLSGFH